MSPLKFARIEIPELPRIPGLAARAFARDNDYPAMVELLNHTQLADGGEAFWTPAVLQNMDASITHFDPPRDRVMLECDGKLIGVGRVQAERNLDGERLYFHSLTLHPDWRRKGIGRAVLRHSERRLREIAASHPQDAP